MTSEHFLRAVGRIKTWKRGNERAPHKPLLLLLALKRVTERTERLIAFTEAETLFSELWRRLGLPGRGRAQYPFRHLVTDGIWEVPRASQLPGWEDGHVRVTELREHDVEGGFPREIHKLLKSDSELVRRAVQIVLDEHFSSSRHDEIRGAVGLPYQVDWATNADRTTIPS